MKKNAFPKTENAHGAHYFSIPPKFTPKRGRNAETTPPTLRSNFAHLQTTLAPQQFFTCHAYLPM